MSQASPIDEGYVRGLRKLMEQGHVVIRGRKNDSNAFSLEVLGTVGLTVFPDNNVEENKKKSHADKTAKKHAKLISDAVGAARAANPEISTQTEQKSDSAQCLSSTSSAVVEAASHSSTDFSALALLQPASPTCAPVTSCVVGEPTCPALDVFPLERKIYDVKNGNALSSPSPLLRTDVASFSSSTSASSFASSAASADNASHNDAFKNVPLEQCVRNSLDTRVSKGNSAIRDPMWMAHETAPLVCEKSVKEPLVAHPLLNAFAEAAENGYSVLLTPDAVRYQLCLNYMRYREFLPPTQRADDAGARRANATFVFVDSTKKEFAEQPLLHCWPSVLKRIEHLLHRHAAEGGDNTACDGFFDKELLESTRQTVATTRACGAAYEESEFPRVPSDVLSQVMTTLRAVHGPLPFSPAGIDTTCAGGKQSSSSASSSASFSALPSSSAAFSAEDASFVRSVFDNDAEKRGDDDGDGDDDDDDDLFADDTRKRPLSAADIDKNSLDSASARWLDRFAQKASATTPIAFPDTTPPGGHHDCGKKRLVSLRVGGVASDWRKLILWCHRKMTIGDESLCNYLCYSLWCLRNIFQFSAQFYREKNDIHETIDASISQTCGPYNATAADEFFNQFFWMKREKPASSSSASSTSSSSSSSSSSLSSQNESLRVGGHVIAWLFPFESDVTLCWMDGFMTRSGSWLHSSVAANNDDERERYEGEAAEWYRVCREILRRRLNPLKFYAMTSLNVYGVSARNFAPEHTTTTATVATVAKVIDLRLYHGFVGFYRHVAKAIGNMFVPVRASMFFMTRVAKSQQRPDEFHRSLIPRGFSSDTSPVVSYDDRFRLHVATTERFHHGYGPETLKIDRRFIDSDSTQGYREMVGYAMFAEQTFADASVRSLSAMFHAIGEHGGVKAWLRFNDGKRQADNDKNLRALVEAKRMIDAEDAEEKKHNEEKQANAEDEKNADEKKDKVKKEKDAMKAENDQEDEKNEKNDDEQKKDMQNEKKEEEQREETKNSEQKDEIKRVSVSQCEKKDKDKQSKGDGKDNKNNQQYQEKRVKSEKKRPTSSIGKRSAKKTVTKNAAQVVASQEKEQDVQKEQKEQREQQQHMREREEKARLKQEIKQRQLADAAMRESRLRKEQAEKKAAAEQEELALAKLLEAEERIANETRRKAQKKHEKSRVSRFSATSLVDSAEKIRETRDNVSLESASNQSNCSDATIEDRDDENVDNTIVSSATLSSKATSEAVDNCRAPRDESVGAKESSATAIGLLQGDVSAGSVDGVAIVVADSTGTARLPNAQTQQGVISGETRQEKCDCAIDIAAAASCTHENASPPNVATDGTMPPNCATENASPTSCAAENASPTSCQPKTATSASCTAEIASQKGCAFEITPTKLVCNWISSSSGDLSASAPEMMCVGETRPLFTTDDVHRCPLHRRFPIDNAYAQFLPMLRNGSSDRNSGNSGNSGSNSNNSTLTSLALPNGAASENCVISASTLYGFLLAHTELTMPCSVDGCAFREQRCHIEPLLNVTAPFMRQFADALLARVPAFCLACSSLHSSRREDVQVFYAPLCVANDGTLCGRVFWAHSDDCARVLLDNLKYAVSPGLDVEFRLIGTPQLDSIVRMQISDGRTFCFATLDHVAHAHAKKKSTKQLTQKQVVKTPPLCACAEPHRTFLDMWSDHEKNAKVEESRDATSFSVSAMEQHRENTAQEQHLAYAENGCFIQSTTFPAASSYDRSRGLLPNPSTKFTPLLPLPLPLAPTALAPASVLQAFPAITQNLAPLSVPTAFVQVTDAFGMQHLIPVYNPSVPASTFTTAPSSAGFLPHGVVAACPASY